MIGTTQEVQLKFFIPSMNQFKKPSIIVPARLASTRFPRKLLHEINGKPLIIITAERLVSIGSEFDLFFAVDGREIGEVLNDSGYQTILTDPALPSGTDRIAEANKILQHEKIINVQADEPMVSRSHLCQLVEALDKQEASMSTLAVPFDKREDFLDPNQVKVILDENDYALYFSRSPIPFDRTGLNDWENFKNFACPKKHIGMYGYRSEFLQKFSSNKVGNLEKVESLEQLRALEMGARIAVSGVNEVSIGIDCPEDFIKFTDIYLKSNQ